MIKAENLAFSYGKKQVLENISLTLEKGKLYAIIGPNGSGKTTLLHALARLHKAYGKLEVDSEPYESVGRLDFAKKIALLPQERSVPDMSVFELVCAGRYPYLDMTRRLSAGDIEIAKSAMRETDTEKFAEQSVKKLSGGERQRAYMAMLYAQNTPYVLLDEPTTHLDISHSFEVMELMRRMKNGGKCVVAVLHDLSLALKYADEVILISEGKLVSVLPPRETAKSESFERVFGVACNIVKAGANEETYVITPRK